MRAPAGATIAPMLPELLALVTPPRCSLCARPCPAREPLCSLCESWFRARPTQRTPIPGLDAVVVCRRLRGEGEAAGGGAQVRRAVAARLAGSRRDRRGGAGRAADWGDRPGARGA